MIRERFLRSYTPAKERVKHATRTFNDLAYVGFAYMKLLLNQVSEGAIFPSINNKPPNYPSIEARIWSYTDESWILNRFRQRDKDEHDKREVQFEREQWEAFSKLEKRSKGSGKAKKPQTRSWSQVLKDVRASHRKNR